MRSRGVSGRMTDRATTGDLDRAGQEEEMMTLTKKAAPHPQPAQRRMMRKKKNQRRRTEEDVGKAEDELEWDLPELRKELKHKLNEHNYDFNATDEEHNN
eukprot:10726961-Heterocapsa_arctica.AAC.1